MAAILDSILNAKRHEVAAAKAAVPRARLERQLPHAPPVRDFQQALAGGPPIRLIAEVKKASPSQGVLRANFDPVEIAQLYQAHGATCLSVLTDGPFFQGDLDHLQRIRQAVALPLLRKDFIVDPYQVLQSRCAGADAILLIAECLDDCQLRSLCAESYQLGMVPLVEFHDPANCQRVLDAGASLIGVNNRDLQTFAVDLEHVIQQRQRIPRGCVLVAESGIRCREDVVRLQDAGIDAMLVGQHLVTQQDIPGALRSLLAG